MNKLLIALIASAGVSLVSAQTAAPTAQERQKDVQSATQGGSGSSTSAQKTAAEQAKNTAVSKETAKMSTADKNAAIKGANASGVNPNNDAGQAATAKQQKANVAASKELPKQNADLKTKQGQQQLEQSLQQKSSR